MVKIERTKDVYKRQGLVVVRVGDADRPAGCCTLHGILLAGAVVRKAEEGGVEMCIRDSAYPAPFSKVELIRIVVGDIFFVLG